jgi:hypothetical protein
MSVWDGGGHRKSSDNRWIKTRRLKREKCGSPEGMEETEETWQLDSLIMTRICAFSSLLAVSRLDRIHVVYFTVQITIFLTNFKLYILFSALLSRPIAEGLNNRLGLIYR